MIEARRRRHVENPEGPSSFVAEGKAEIYADVGQQPWGVAACKLIVEEAGGRFTDSSGSPTIYGRSALVTNGRLHETVLRMLQR